MFDQSLAAPIPRARSHPMRAAALVFATLAMVVTMLALATPPAEAYGGDTSPHRYQMQTNSYARYQKATAPIYPTVILTSPVQESVSYVCPAGWSWHGSSCMTMVPTTDTIPAKKTTTNSCPTGAQQKGDQCWTTVSTIETVPIITDVTYSCPPEFSPKGDVCERAISTTEYAPYLIDKSYSCPAGFEGNPTSKADQCTRTETITETIPAIEKTNVTCPHGMWLGSGGKNCHGHDVQVKPVIEYIDCGKNSWGKYDPCGGKKLSCPDGSSKSVSRYGSFRCTKPVIAPATMVPYYECRSGYRLKGTQCTRPGTVTETAPAIVNTAKSCPPGYGDVVNGCSIVVTGVETAPWIEHVTTSCAASYRKAGGQCTRTVETPTEVPVIVDVSYSCPSKYQLRGDTCTKSGTTATFGPPDKTVKLYCPWGYTLSGSGKGTMCTKRVTLIMKWY